MLHVWFVGGPLGCVQWLFLISTEPPPPAALNRTRKIHSSNLFNCLWMWRYVCNFCANNVCVGNIRGIRGCSINCSMSDSTPTRRCLSESVRLQKGCWQVVFKQQHDATPRKPGEWVLRVRPAGA